MRHPDGFSIILSLNPSPPPSLFKKKKKKRRLNSHAKSTLKILNPPEEDPHGSINPVEVRAHADLLDRIMTMIEEQVERKDTADLLERAINDVKEGLTNLTPTMQLADQSTVMRAVRDKCFNVLLPRSDELDQILEEIIPNEDIPGAPDVI